MSEVIAETRDGEGRRVVLDEDGWAHILDRHPLMQPHRSAIIAAVSTPDHRDVDARLPGRHRLYREGWGPSRWLLVVVDYEECPRGS